MKYWSLIVSTVYALVLFILFAPVAMIAFSNSDAWGALRAELSGWPVFLVMGLAQFVLLRVPVRMVSRRPVTRTPLIFTVIAAGFAMMLLVLGAFLSTIEFTKANIPGGNNGQLFLLVLGIGSWLFWAIYFQSLGRRNDMDPSLGGIRKHLVAGSVLELLVAVPTHIIVRQRNECCAGLLTFVGLVTGLSVMLFAFGPAVYFLYASRWQRLHPTE